MNAGRPWKRLSKASREKVLKKNWNLNVDENWWDTVYEEATNLLEQLGYIHTKIIFSGFSYQGDGAQFTGKWEPKMCEPLKVKSEVGPDSPWHGFADRLSILLIKAKLLEQDLPSFNISSSGHYNHEHCTVFDFEYGDIGEVHVDDELIELSRDIMRHIYRMLEEEYSYLTSREVLVEQIIANDYHFDATGRII